MVYKSSHLYADMHKTGIYPQVVTKSKPE